MGCQVPLYYVHMELQPDQEILTDVTRTYTLKSNFLPVTKEKKQIIKTKSVPNNKGFFT